MKVRELINRLLLLDQDKEIYIDYDTVSAIEPIPIDSDFLVGTSYNYTDCYVIIADSYIDKEDINNYAELKDDELYMDSLYGIQKIILKENEKQVERLNQEL